MRILIYGAGVIGSLYATLFADAGYEWLGGNESNPQKFP